MNTRYLNQYIDPCVKYKKRRKEEKERKNLIRGGLEHITQMTSPGR